MSMLNLLDGEIVSLVELKQLHFSFDILVEFSRRMFKDLLLLEGREPR